MALSFHDVLRALVRGDRLPDTGEALAAIDAHEAAQAPPQPSLPAVPDSGTLPEVST